MNPPLRILSVLGIVAATFIAGTTLSAKDPEPAVKKTFDKLMTAVQDNDRAAFVANATDAVKEGTTPQIMDFLHKHLGTRLKAGYQSVYLCDLKQQGVQIHLWKLTFKDKGDDVVVRIGLKEGKVDGFFLQ